MNTCCLLNIACRCTFAAERCRNGSIKPTLTDLGVYNGLIQPTLTDLGVYSGSILPTLTDLGVYNGSIKPTLTDLGVYSGSILPTLTDLGVCYTFNNDPESPLFSFASGNYSLTTF